MASLGLESGDDDKHSTFESIEDDDWSRQVETDETTGVHTEDVTNVAGCHDAPRPPRELSLKEKLVMRERERRIETERARLKRQFVLSNQTVGVDGQSGDQTGQQLPLPPPSRTSEGETLGEESVVAHPDEEDESEDRRLGFNMERFLRNSDSFNPQLETMEEETGVLMERFLSEPVLPNQTVDPITRSVSFEVDGQTEARNSSLVLSDTAFENQLPHGDVHDSSSDTISTSTRALEEPRVLRLTEADMQELAAIDEVSIGNAPPSERADSEIGDLAGFPQVSHDNHASFSAGTPTTAMDSASLLSATVKSEHELSAQGSVIGVASDIAEPSSPAADSHDTHSVDETAEIANQTRSLSDADIVPAQPSSLTQNDTQLTEELPNTLIGADALRRGPSPEQWSQSAAEMAPYGSSTEGASSYIARANGTRPLIPVPQLPPLSTAEKAPHCSEETMPLLDDVPPEIITRNLDKHTECQHADTSQSGMTSMIETLRSGLERHNAECATESDKYVKGSMCFRGTSCWDRVFSLHSLTLFAVCNSRVVGHLVGSTTQMIFLVIFLHSWIWKLSNDNETGKYDDCVTLAGFIVIANSASGNFAVQTSFLFMKAVQKSHMTTQSLKTWILAESAASCLIGLCLGTVAGVAVYVLFRKEIALSFVAFGANVFIFGLAGFTGTAAPFLVNRFRFGPFPSRVTVLASSLQDLTGFVVFLACYQAMELLR